jgi:hypothetical protein
VGDRGYSVKESVRSPSAEGLVAKNFGVVVGEAKMMLSRARGTSEKVPRIEEVGCGGALVEEVEPRAEENPGE